MLVPQKTKQIILWFNNSTSGYVPQRTESGNRKVFADCVHNISHTSWEVKRTKCLLVDKQRVVCTQNRIFLSLKKGRNTACYKGDEAWGRNAQWNIESVTKDEYCMIPLRRSLEESNPCRQKEGGAGLGIYGFMDRISVWGRWDGSGGEDWWQLHSNSNELNIPELCTKKCCVCFTTNF